MYCAWYAFVQMFVFLDVQMFVTCMLKIKYGRFKLFSILKITLTKLVLPCGWRNYFLLNCFKIVLLCSKLLSQTSLDDVNAGRLNFSFHFTFQDTNAKAQTHLKHFFAAFLWLFSLPSASFLNTHIHFLDEKKETESRIEIY